MIDYIKTLLGTNADLNQVVAAYELGGNFVDASTILVSTLEGEVSNRMYAQHLPEGTKTYPNIVYEWAAVKPIYIDGFPLLRTDVYILTSRESKANGLSGFVTLASSVDTAINAYSVTDEGRAMERTESGAGYESELDTYTQLTEVVISHIDSSSQAMPLAVISIDKVQAEESEVVPMRQRVHTEFSVYLLAPSVDMEDIRDSVLTTLLGVSQTSENFGIEYVSGQKVETVGHMMLWKETYTDSIIIRE